MKRKSIVAVIVCIAALFFNDILSELIKGIYVYADKRIEIVWNFKEQ